MPSSRLVQALVVKRRPFGEADRLVTLFTFNNGLQKVIAKGVRKIPSRRGGHLEPLTRVTALLRTVRDQHYLAAVETLDVYPALREEVATQQHAQLVLNAMILLLEEEQSYPHLFKQLEHAWKTWPQIPTAKRYILETTLLSTVLHCAGVQPNITHCMICGISQPKEAVILDGTIGGWRCLSCHPSLYGTRYSISPLVLKALRFITMHPERAIRLRLTDDQAIHSANAMRNYMAAITQRKWPMIQESIHTYAR